MSNVVDFLVYAATVLLVAGWSAAHAYHYGYAKGRRDEMKHGRDWNK